MKQVVEGKSIPVFFAEAIYPAGESRQLVCPGFRPATADNWSQTLRADGD